jgi:hypothetical protein
MRAEHWRWYSRSVSRMDAFPPQRAVARLYADAAGAQAAIQALRSGGVPTDAISVLSRSAAEADAIEHATGASDDMEDVAVRRHPLSDLVSWLGSVESVLVPGFGGVLGSGNLWQDVARGASTRGGITGVLVGIGIDVDDASQFEESVWAGQLLVTVYGSNVGLSAERIEAILDSANS